MKRWKKQIGSLRFQVLAPIFAVVLVTILLIIIPSSRDFKNSMTEMGTEDAKTLAEALFGGIKPSITQGNSEAVQELLDEVKRSNPGIQIAVLRYDGLIRQNTLRGESTENIFDFLKSEENKKDLENFLNQNNNDFLQFESSHGNLSHLNLTMLLPNEKACYHCHGSNREVLGAMYISIPNQKIYNKIASFSRRNIFFGGLGIIALATLIYLILNSRVLKPMNQLVKSHRIIGTGDLRHKISGKFYGEMEDLVDSFNGFIDQIVGMIKTVKDGCQQVRLLVDSITSSSHEFASASEEQSSQSEEIASSVEEMTSAIMETSQNTSGAADLAKEASDKALSGSEAMEQTTNGFDTISASFNDTRELIDELSTKASQIGEVTNVITEIADQTNLLALNAAIEAARAGEMGRGFAVVADEVRKLAERTAGATDEIARTIKSIQDDIKKASESTELVDTNLGHGRELVTKSAEILKEIDQKIQSVSNMIQQIAVAAEEESSAASEISSNLEMITSVAKESAKGATQLADTADNLSEETLRLTDVVDQFKIDESV